MLFQNAEGRKKDRGPSGLSALEIEAIEMFINFLKIIGLQRSIGEIYGLLFVSAKPLSMDDIVNRLGYQSGGGQPGAEASSRCWERSSPSTRRATVAIISRRISS